MLKVLRFRIGNQGDMVSQFGGQIVLVRRGSPVPVADRDYICDLEVRARIVIARPICTVDSVRWSLHTDPSKAPVLGLSAMRAVPECKEFRELSLQQPSEAYDMEWRANAPFREAEKFLRRLYDSRVTDLCADIELGTPAITRVTQDKGVTLMWQHPTYGRVEVQRHLGLQSLVTLGAVATGQLRISGTSIVTEVRIPTGESMWIHAGSKYGVDREVTETTPWLVPFVTAYAAHEWAADEAGISGMLADYASRLATWDPNIVLRAMFAADPEGERTRVEKIRFQIKVDYAVADEDGYVTRWEQEEIREEIRATPGFLKSIARAVNAFDGTTMVVVRPDGTPSPETPPYAGRRQIGSVVSHPADAAALHAAVVALPMEPPWAPTLEAAWAQSPEAIAAFQESVDGLLQARQKAIADEITKLVAEVQTTYQADDALMAIRAEVEAEMASVRRLARDYGAQAELPPLPAPAEGCTVKELEGEGLRLGRWLAACRATVEAVAQRHRVAVADVATETVLGQAPAPAGWFLDGISEAEVSEIVGLPAGSGLSGAVLRTPQRAEAGAAPLVAIQRAFAGGKRWRRSVESVVGLHILFDLGGGVVSGSPRSPRSAVLLVAAVTRPDWCVTIVTYKDGEEYGREVVCAHPDLAPAPAPEVPVTPASISDLAAKWGRRV